MAEHLADTNGDGYLDLVANQIFSSNVAVSRHPGTNLGDTWEPHVIISGVTCHSDMWLADMDWRWPFAAYGAGWLLARPLALAMPQWRPDQVNLAGAGLSLLLLLGSLPWRLRVAWGSRTPWRRRHGTPRTGSSCCSRW